MPDMILNAFISSFFIALVAGVLGWLMLVRGQAFAAHALPDIAFSGGSVALVLGVNPLIGLLFAALMGGWMMEGLHFYEKRRHSTIDRFASDRLTGLVLAGCLAVGMGVLEVAHVPETDTVELLFGGLLHLSAMAVFLSALVSFLCLAGLFVLFRPLLFSALSPEMAQVRNKNSDWAGAGFMTLAALGCALCAEISGALLAFSLIIGPASGAFILNLSPFKGIVFSVGGALLLSWGGIGLYLLTGWPPAFWIGIGALLCYGLCLFCEKYFDLTHYSVAQDLQKPLK